MRKSGDFLGVHLNLRPSIERDLMIRKLFTSAVANTSVDISVVCGNRHAVEEYLVRAHYFRADYA